MRQSSTQRRVDEAAGPPLTADEMRNSLSVLERDLNGRMQCPAGKNQVFIRSVLLGRSTTKPRLALRCTLRKDAGMPADVFYEHIRDVCCTNPSACEAYRQFQARLVRT